MVFNQDTWKAAYKKAASDLSNRGASDGIVCVLATLRIIRDGIKDDIGNTSDEDKAFCSTIDDSIAELWTSCKGAKLAGFASNASAAAKACKLTVSADASVDVDC